MQFISELPLSEIKNLLEFATNEEQENVTFDMWKSLYPYMQMGHIEPVNYIDFKNSVSGNANTENSSYNCTDKTKNEIENDILKVVKYYKGKEGN